MVAASHQISLYNFKVRVLLLPLFLQIKENLHKLLQLKNFFFNKKKKKNGKLIILLSILILFFFYFKNKKLNQKKNIKK